MSLVDKSAWAVLVVGAVGCAHTPDVKVGYYLPKTTVAVKLQRTIACDAKQAVVMVDTVTTTTTHMADTGKLIPLETRDLRGFLTESDLKFEFYDDGRLKAVNAATTGKGEEILKAALSVVSSIGAKRTEGHKVTAKDQCDYIKDSGTDGKTLSLTYEKTLDLDLAHQTIPPDMRSQVYADALKIALGEVCVDVGKVVVNAPIQWRDEPGDVLLELRQPALVTLKISTEPGCAALRWEGTVPVAQKGKDYKMPIPRAAVFGRQQLGASFAESGAMTLVQYVSSPGAGQVLNVLNSALGLSKEIADKQAAEIGAEASLIAAQQRLIRCKTDPSKC